MQTAVDCNGSSSSNNNTTTTTTTIMESSNSGSIGGCNGGAGELLSHEQSNTAPPSRSTPAVLLTPVAMLEQTNVLRHRLQVGVGVGHSIGTSVMNYGCPATVGVSHKISSTPTHLIDMAEYLGSNIERMSVTPSPSPQASPSKKVLQRNAETAPTLTPAPPPPPLKPASNAELMLVPSQSNNSSSTSSSNSSSNSSTSSVIATPVSIKRELARRRAQYGEANVDDVCGIGGVLGATEDILALSGRDRAERRDILANRGLPLNTANHEEHLSVITPTTPLTPLTPTLTSPSPSLSSSSSSVAPSTKSASHKSSTESSSLISSTAVTPTKNASKLNSLSTTILPAFNSPAQLQHIYEMPKYLQFNPYVLNGYRPLTTFRGCLLSLFYWHNETVNILTHGEKFKIKEFQHSESLAAT
ncbi:unnamed protein product [Ceratitis capitata]|uniref:(Mediterranean fruit fly) hypothetical protein n=1 Tax=Ceratitis capitata TaxID=7213 RepID=A0A811U8J4_CERCA|nr:unnamed protein product [Ceratitis capitata]